VSGSRSILGGVRLRRSALLTASLVLVAASGTAAQGATLSVEPSHDLRPDGATLSITGSGFSSAGNGIYVVFGPIVPAPDYYLDPSIYAAFRWVHAGAGDSPIEAPLADDGSFATTLEVAATFTTPSGDVDCAVSACAVITFAAHGSPDRSQDTCVEVTFGPAGASAAPATIPPATPQETPVSSMDPTATSVAVEGPCSMIGALPASAAP
jgi:hypothetical protein